MFGTALHTSALFVADDFCFVSDQTV